MRRCGLVLLVLALLLALLEAADLHLSTTDEGYLTVIQGFATQLQCVLNTCSPNVVWHKDNVLFFNGTQFEKRSGLDESSFLLQHKVDVDFSKGCTGECDDSTRCPSGSTCVDNACCPCRSEDFTLVLRNLSFDDAGRYRCSLADQPEQLEFQVEVLESGLRGGFHENISYDHSECCAQKGISSMCQAMCKPSDMDVHFFDPTSCKTDDYKNFLSCATNNGTRSHVHCCRTNLVPSFCYDFCSGNFQMLRRSHRLCLYYLPEIFECYNRAYLPYPDPPEAVQVNAVEADKLSVCWKPPTPQDSNRHFPVKNYTVFYKQIPSFPFLGGGDDSPLGGIPLLTEDYTEGSEHDGAAEDYSEVEHSETTTEGTVEVRRKKRDNEPTWVFVTHDPHTNASTVREFKFFEVRKSFIPTKERVKVNTTETCATLNDLRSATRYLVYVVSRNDYGTSVPSERSIASTNVFVSSANSSLSNALQCCKDNNVSSYCYPKMCDVNATPNSFTSITIATTCRTEWPKASPCIADGRNHTECCLRKGVQHECLKICGGEPAVLSLHSVLCLNLDLNAIYQCLREGYETHPSPPVNVTVEEIGETQATVRWEEPLQNAHLVTTYTLFFRKSEHGATLREVKDAVSPHVELGLDPNSEYSVSVQSHSANGTSLPSTAVLFFTGRRSLRLCPKGEPLYQPDGVPVSCNDQANPCPSSHYCFSFPSADEQESLCCPKGASSSSSSTSFASCCQDEGVPPDCLSSCAFNSTLDPRCGSHLNAWIRCASEGRDHSRCCEQRNVAAHCRDACHHPFQVDVDCVDETPLLLYCFSRSHTQVPMPVRNLQVHSTENSLVQVLSLNSTSVLLSWEAPLAAVSTYEVQLFSGSQQLNRTNVTTTSIMFPSLTESTEYAARVIAFNELASSSPSFNLSFVTPSSSESSSTRPSAPTALRVVWNSGSRVNISWEAPKLRLNGQPVGEALNYSLFFFPSHDSAKFSTLSTSSTWAVMVELQRDELYSVYVTAQEGDEKSDRSSVLTIIAQPDTMSLPEPVIHLNPDKFGDVYEVGDEVKAECEVAVAAPHFNVDLHIGGDIVCILPRQFNVQVHNEPGSTKVEATRKVNESFSEVSCAVTAPDGTQNVAVRHLFVQFGPMVRIPEPHVEVFADLAAELKCIVSGFPPPDTYWTHDGKRLEGSSIVRTTALNTFEFIYRVQNATGRGGEYECVAERAGSIAKESLRLSVKATSVPEDVTAIRDCCVEEKVTGDCLKACGPLDASERSALGNCSSHADGLLKCANDIRDHTDCCLGAGVSGRCLRLCAGDSVSAGHGCEEFAVAIIQCVLRGHAKTPKPVDRVAFKRLGPSRLEVSWEERPEANEYFVLFYREKSTDEVRTQTSRSHSAVLDVDTDSPVQVGVVAVNAFGHSPLQLQDVSLDPSDSSSGGSLWPIVVFLLVSVLFVVVVFKVRRDGWPGHPRPLSRNDPTVAFENPGYNSSEVEIRGLSSSHNSAPSADWTSADLQPPPANGRYAKLQET